MRTLMLVMLLLAAAPAAAAPPDPQGGMIGVPGQVAAPAPKASPEMPMFGVALDVGFPEGLAPSLLFRPWAPLRFRAGPAWNYFSWGVQGGVDLIPFTWAVAPVLSLEAGRQFSMDISRVADSNSGLHEVLRDLSYTHAGALLGLEFGRRGLVFSIRGGAGYVWADAHGRGTVKSSSNPNTSYYVADPTFRGGIPYVKLGLHYAFY